MDLKSVVARPGFKQGLQIDSSGRVAETAGTERIAPAEVVSFQRACARLGERLGLGALTGFSSDVPNDSSLHVLIDGKSVTATVFAAAGDALDDRAREIAHALDPDRDAIVKRHMGFMEVRR